ncbi:MAG: alpha/beta fold hydrolase [Pseudomonadales bacterium]
MINERRIATNGIQLKIAEQGEGPLVLLLHGFPESWYSWRHQFAPIAGAGFKCVAPDMRGYGESDAPDNIGDYNQVEVVKDIVGLVQALGYETAIVIGHDWGAPTAWACAKDYPEVFTAVGALSVPFSPRPEAPPLDTMKAIFKDMFFYQLYFQEPGVAEAEFEKDLEVSLRKFLYIGSGEAELGDMQPKPADADLLSDIPDPGKLGPWCTAEDLAYYVSQFEKHGFHGPISYYRNHNETWEMTADKPTEIHQPAMFVAGEKDGVIVMAAEALKNMPTYVKDLRINELIPGAGHWTQQEAPEQVNDYILQFLKEVG